MWTNLMPFGTCSITVPLLLEPQLGCDPLSAVAAGYVGVAATTRRFPLAALDPSAAKTKDSRCPSPVAVRGSRAGAGVRCLRLAIDKPRRLHQSFRLAPSTACAFAALRGAGSGQPAWRPRGRWRDWGVAPGGAGWARAVGGKGPLIFLYSLRARQSVDESSLCRGGRSRLGWAVLAGATTRGEVGGSRRRRIREKPNSKGRASNECRLAARSSPLTSNRPANTSSRPGGISRGRRQRLKPASWIEKTGTAASTSRWGTVRSLAATQWHERGRWHRAHPGLRDLRAPRAMRSDWGRPGSAGCLPLPGRRGRQRHARSLE